MSKLKDVKQFIEDHDFFYILGHEKPDGDCIGSELAISGLLEKLNKPHAVLSAGPFSDSISQSYRPRFIDNLDDLDYLPMEEDNAALIFVDASSPERMGNIFSPIFHLPTLIIDHHKSTALEDTENAQQVKYIEPTIPANTILVYRLFKEFRINPTQEDAYFILLGILTDTQFFRFVKSKDKEPFTVAAELIEYGVTPGDIYKQISYGYTYLSRKVIAEILNRTQRLNNNRIILTYISYNNYIHIDDIPQTYEIYQMLEGTHKTEIVVYLQEILNDNNIPVTKVGMRSKQFDVGSIAKKWGGGGHANASGFTIEQSLNESLPTLVTFFDALVL